MKSRVVLTTLLVAVAGALLLWQQSQLRSLSAENAELRRPGAALSVPRRAPTRTTTTEADPAELQRLRDAEQELKLEVARLRNRLSSALRSQAEAETRRLATPLADAGESAGDSTNAFSRGMGEAMKGVIANQLEGRFARLKQKVHLTPEQETAMREIMAKQVEVAAGAAQKVLAGKMTREEMRRVQESTGNPEEQIKALLTPDQQSAYQEYHQEENRSTARMAANAELLQLQSTLQLSEEQENQVFATIYDQTLSTMEGGAALALPAGADPAAVLEWQMNQKAKALEGVLTAEQMESYQRYQQNQLKFLKMMMPQETAEGGP